MPTQCVAIFHPVWSCCKARSTCSSSVPCLQDPLTGTPSPGRDRVIVSGAPPAGGERLDRGLLGAVREREARQVLSPHAARTQTARSRTVEMGGVLPRRRIDLESSRPGGTMNSFLSQIALADAMSLERSRTARGTPVSPGEEAEQRHGDGLAAEEARWAARRELGNISLVEEKVSYNVARRTERSPGAHSFGNDPVECCTPGRLHACTERVSNRPDDCCAARVSWVVPAAAAAYRS